MNLYQEAKALALEAIEECEGNFEEAREWIWQTCDSHEIAIYYDKAIKFCADNNTSAGEEFLEDGGGIAQPGDSFGQIACRIAFATLYCAACEELEALDCEEVEE